MPYDAAAANPDDVGKGGGLLAAVRPTFRAVTVTVVPEAALLDETGWHALDAIVERALADRPAKMQRQLRILLRVIQWVPLVRHGCRFTALGPVDRRRVLEWFQNAPAYVLRRGFWGLRTLIFMGYYARPEAAAEIGYRGDPRGWEART